MKPSGYLIVAVMLFAGSSAYSDETQSLFNPEAGVLEITNLQFEQKLYYIKLRLVDPNNLTFVVDMNAVEDITPTNEEIYRDPVEITGRWTWEGRNISYTFNPDGTFSMYQGPNEDPLICPDGGSEIGLYTWTPSTGIFRANVFFDKDTNGACGFSNVENHIRIRVIESNELEMSEGGEFVGKLLKIQS